MNLVFINGFENVGSHSKANDCPPISTECPDPRVTLVSNDSSIMYTIRLPCALENRIELAMLKLNKISVGDSNHYLL